MTGCLLFLFIWGDNYADTGVFTLWFIFTAIANDYDLVINNGRIMEPESNFEAVANVGIPHPLIMKDGKINKNSTSYSFKNSKEIT